jgi:hypothetical protein
LDSIVFTHCTELSILQAAVACYSQRCNFLQGVPPIQPLIHLFAWFIIKSTFLCLPQRECIFVGWLINPVTLAIIMFMQYGLVFPVFYQRSFVQKKLSRQDKIYHLNAFAKINALFTENTLKPVSYYKIKANRN